MKRLALSNQRRGHWQWLLLLGVGACKLPSYADYATPRDAGADVADTGSDACDGSDEAHRAPVAVQQRPPRLKVGFPQEDRPGWDDRCTCGQSDATSLT